MRRVFVSGAFDEVGSRQLRFLQEAARFGPVTLFLWPDADIERIEGLSSGDRKSRMGLAERRYYFEALSYVDKIEISPAGFEPDALPIDASAGEFAWAVYAAPGGAPGKQGSRSEAANAAKLSWCRSRRGDLVEIPEAALAGFPYAPPAADRPRSPGTKRVVVTGCYDYLHTGHLRFFEEASSFGELNVVIGSDVNVRFLKGEGHPLFSEGERRYQVGSFRSVARCLVSSGSGWLDAEPEIRSLGIERYVVNEDGDKPEKRRYCEENGIEYIVLKRVPKEGLPRRSSTDLRGF
jgi:cytidyltransferase-like protein